MQSLAHVAMEFPRGTEFVAVHLLLSAYNCRRFKVFGSISVQEIDCGGGIQCAQSLCVRGVEVSVSFVITAALGKPDAMSELLSASNSYQSQLVRDYFSDSSLPKNTARADTRTIHFRA